MASFIDMGVDLSDRCAHLPARRVNLVELLSCLSRRPIFLSDSLSLRGRSKAKILAEKRNCIGKKLYKIITS